MKRYLAELIGTFALVFCGTGAIIINEVTQGAVTHTGISITFGLIVMCMIITLGDISGAHLNPAVTLAFVVSKRFSARQAIPYILYQCSGALMASLVLKILFPSSVNLGATIPYAGDLQSFILELILSLLLMLVILNVSMHAKEKGLLAAAAIGAIVGLEAMFAGPISGASMNPARSLGPAILSGNINHLWLYLTAPVLGALSAIPIHKSIN